MTISVGDSLPVMDMKLGGPDGPQDVNTRDLFKGKTVVLFSVPGAFTPTCSTRHLPGFVERADALKAKGVDEIICLSVNDPFVMTAWARSADATGKITMLADGNCTFTRALGLTQDSSAAAMGERGQRFALIARDGTVEHLFIEEPKQFNVSSADNVLAHL